MLNVDCLAAAVSLKEVGYVLVICLLVYNLQILPANGRGRCLMKPPKTLLTTRKPCYHLPQKIIRYFSKTGGASEKFRSQPSPLFMPRPTISFMSTMRVWIHLKSWELYGKDRSNLANLYEKTARLSVRNLWILCYRNPRVFVLAFLTLLWVVVEWINAKN